ncbi:hypothetical protein [Neobacillus cucumis]|nr:hypothetical protein [Neobacillus cucumis]
MYNNTLYKINGRESIMEKGITDPIVIEHFIEDRYEVGFSGDGEK